MTSAELIELLYQACLRYLARRPRSEDEMRRYLVRKTQQYSLARIGITEEEVITTILKRLKEHQYIDDAEFIAWWVDQRSYFRPRGKRALRAELYKKGVDRALVETYFEQNTLNEVQLAYEVLLKKARTIVILPQNLQYKKALTLLMSRGFSFDSAKKAFEQWQKKE